MAKFRPTSDPTRNSVLESTHQLQRTSHQDERHRSRVDTSYKGLHIMTRDTVLESTHQLQRTSHQTNPPLGLSKLVRTQTMICGLSTPLKILGIIMFFRISLFSLSQFARGNGPHAVSGVLTQSPREKHESHALLEGLGGSTTPLRRSTRSACSSAWSAMLSTTPLLPPARPRRSRRRKRRRNMAVRRFK